MRPRPLRDAANLQGEDESRVVAEGRRGGVRAKREESIRRTHGPLNLSGIESRAAPD